MNFVTNLAQDGASCGSHRGLCGRKKTDKHTKDCLLIPLSSTLVIPHRHLLSPRICCGSHYPDCFLWPLQVQRCQVFLSLLELPVLLFTLSGLFPTTCPHLPNCIKGICQRSSPVSSQANSIFTLVS